MLTHRNLAQASFAYLTEVDAAAPGDSILHAAPMSHGSGLYMMAHVARMGINVVPESGSFEPDEIFRLFATWRGMSMFAAPTMVKRLVDFGGGADPSNLRTIVWGGAPMYVEDALEGARPLRAAARADLRPGRKPDDHHDAVAPGHRRPRASALARAARLGRAALCVPRREGGGRAGQCAARGRDRRDHLPRRRGDAGLLAQPRCDRADHARRLAAHRRCRRVRRRRLSDA